MTVYTDPVSILLSKLLSKDGNGLKEEQLERLALAVLAVVMFFGGMAVLATLLSSR